MASPNFYHQVYEVVRRVPPGKVTSYGRIAALLGAPRAARAVGYALRALKDQPEDDSQAPVPWHRVINSQGYISIVNREHGAAEQARRLREEGIVVDDKFRVDMSVYLWVGLHWLEIDDILEQLRGTNG